MKTPGPLDHQARVEMLWTCVLEGPGETSAPLRQAVAARAAGGAPIEPPLDDLAHQIGEAADRTTDAQVAGVAENTGERAAFELIVAAAVGAGLERWRRGIAVLEEATRAPR